MTIKRIFAVWMAALLLTLGLPAFAQPLDAARNVSLTVRFRHDGKGLPGAQIKLYHVADVNADGGLTLISPFDQYPIQIEGRSESEMAGIATTLEGYILRDAVAPAVTAVTNQYGSAAFAGIEQGLYLILGDRYAAEGTNYTIQPSMVQLPFWNAAEERWDYEVMMNAKYSFAPDAATVTRKVLKVWENVEGVTELPQEITVHLLQDGEVHDTVVLTAENLWRHTWLDLDATSRWTVVEDELDDYIVNITQEGITFVITNTYDPDEPVPTPTPPPTDPDKPQLPQTGQLWWPVPMLISLGLLLIVIGLLRRRGR